MAGTRRGQAQVRKRRLRSDAEHNAAMILEAATLALRDEPEASMDDIARAAGLSRQTIYAHFPSREALVGAVIERATADATEILAASEPKEGTSPAEALAQLLDVGWELSRRYPFLWYQPAVSEEEDVERHRPVLDQLDRLIRAGQASGDLDARFTPRWLLTAMLALGRAAEDEVKAKRMTIDEATDALRQSAMRLLGLERPDKE